MWIPAGDTSKRFSDLVRNYARRRNHGGLPDLVNRTRTRTQAFEIKCFRRFLQVSYREQNTSSSGVAAGYSQVTLKWFGHVAPHDTSPKTVLQGYDEGGRPRGKQKKGWVGRERKSMTMTV